MTSFKVILLISLSIFAITSTYGEYCGDDSSCRGYEICGGYGSCVTPSITINSVNFPGFSIQVSNKHTGATSISKYGHNLFAKVPGVNTDDGSDLFLKDSSFYIRPALDGGQGESYESVNYPGYFIRHQNYIVKISRKEHTHLFKKDASWITEY